MKYDDIAQICQVTSEGEVNLLLELGWKLLETSHEDEKLTQETFWSYKTIGTKSVLVYIMGRTTDVAVKKSGESVYYYYERIIQAKHK